MTGRAEPASEVRRARRGVFGVFLLSGFTVALWGAALPALNQRLDLGEAKLGTVLLATGLGALTCMPVAGRWCDRWTSRRIVIFAGPAAAVGLLGPALAPTFPALLVTTFVFGAGIGALDVSMNAHSIEVEQRYPRPIISAFHGVWSLGGVVGGSLIGLGLYLRVDVQAVMAVGAVLAALTFLPPTRMLLTGAARSRCAGEAGDGPASSNPLPRRLVLALGVVAFAAFIAEGAAMDWSALHAHRVLGADLAIASIAYTAFTVAMTATRLLGDRLRDRFGPVWTIQKAAGTATTGYLVVLTAPALPSGGLPCAYAGWVLVGVGLAMVVPVIFAAAGTGNAAGRTLSRVTTFGYVGMLAGPSVIGPVAEATSLATALALPTVLALGIAALGPIAVRRVTGQRTLTEVRPAYEG